MENEYLHSFELLKRQMVETCRVAFPYLPHDLQGWKGAEIACFQEVLEEKTKGRISEKSFYNYFKTGKIPREDVLDLFAQMVGEIHWKDFVHKNKTSENLPFSVQAENIAEIRVNETPPKSFVINRKIVLGVFVGLGLICGLFYAAKQKTATHLMTRICFEDAYTHRPIVESVEVYIINDKAKQVFRSDSMGCVVWENRAERLSFCIKSPYYKADTLQISGNEQQTVLLKPDDYAMMIRLYASGKIEDWEAHLGRLEAMFAADAAIFQIERETGYIMEVWNKGEFIEKLTTPIPSLQQLEVLETEYNPEKEIRVLRFWQK